MHTPMDAFLIWFESLPPALRTYLAHLFRVCTTEDASMLALHPDQSLDAFRRWVAKTDFPLRLAARVFHVRAVFDMAVFHHKEMLAADDWGRPILPGREKIVQLSEKQWDAVAESWKDLRHREMSDKYVHSWTSWMIRLHGGKLK